MDRIKSAFEKAMEKAERLGSATQAELLEWKWVPGGRKLAAEYLKGRINLRSELAKHEEEQRSYVLRGVKEVLAANILLPKSPSMKETTDKAIQGLRDLEGDKGRLEEIASRIEYVLGQYLTYGVEQQQQAYQQLKEKVMEAVRQQGDVPADAEVNVEALPQFQQEWLRISDQLDRSYEEHLDGYKKAILGLK